MSVKTRRPTLAISGWTLLVCLFLPTLRVCGDPTAPIEFPPTYVLYVGSAVVGALALAQTVRARRGAFGALVVLWYLSLAGIGVAWAGAEAFPAGFFVSVVGLAIGIWLVLALVKKPASDRVIAGACAVHALACVLWNGLLAADPEAMWGAAVALVASVVMLVTACVYVTDEQRAHVERRRDAPPPLPTARVVR